MERIYFWILHHFIPSIHNPVPIGLEFSFCITHDVFMSGERFLDLPPFELVSSQPYTHTIGIFFCVPHDVLMCGVSIFGFSTM